MDRYAKIAGRSDKKEVKAIKKGDSMRAQFYKRQAEEVTKYLESAARMLVSYSSTPERTKKANNFISLISNKPLMEIATRKLFNDRESNRGDESAKRMYEITKRGKTKFKKYGRDIV